jgi:hypothetical protein
MDVISKDMAALLMLVMCSRAIARYPITKIRIIEISIIYSDNPLLALAEYAEQNLPIHIFTGKQADKSSFVMKLAESCKLPVSMVAGETVFTVTN